MFDGAPLDVEGPLAPPRKNGELAFGAPWEGRVFALALALVAAGTITWEEFRRALIEEIRRWERVAPSDSTWSYYERWAAALEAVLVARGIATDGDVAALEDALRRRDRHDDHDH
jgi:nitrile hydratase accessory protein